MSTIVFHIQNAAGAGIGGASLSAVSAVLGAGNWQAVTNLCGDFITPTPGLAPGHYDITISAPGYVTRVLPADLQDSGIVTVGLELGVPVFKTAPRFWQANMCGTRVAGLPPLYKNADPSLVLSWFYDRYTNPDHRALIRADWKSKRLTHTILSWPDAKANGCTPEQFRGICWELIADDFYPCPFLTSKDFDSGKSVDQLLAELEPVISLLLGVVPMACIGFELSLFLTPTQLIQLIYAIAPRFVAAQARVYIHLQEGYMSWPQPGKANADFWKLLVGMITGILLQKALAQPLNEFAGWIHDVLDRMAGNEFMPTDSGFGHPFDAVACELNATYQFNGTNTEADGNALGDFALAQPAVSGPAGSVSIMGVGNGWTPR